MSIPNLPPLKNYSLREKMYNNLEVRFLDLHRQGKFVVESFDTANMWWHVRIDKGELQLESYEYQGELPPYHSKDCFNSGIITREDMADSDFVDDEEWDEIYYSLLHIVETIEEKGE